MPLFPKQTAIEQKADVSIEEMRPDTATVFQSPNEKQIDPLTQEIAGDPWTLIAIYSQLLGDEDLPHQLDDGLDAPLQQYLKIHNPEIRVTSALGNDTDDNYISIVSGEANLYPGFKVNQWDILVGRTKDGRVGVFYINEAPKPFTYLSWTGYTVQFTLYRYYDQAIADQLTVKTQIERYFNPDSPCVLCNTIVDVQSNVNASQEIMRLLDWFYNHYYDKSIMSFSFKDKSANSYFDSEVPKFLGNILPYELRRLYPTFNNYEAESIEYRRRNRTVLDLLVDGEMTEWMNIFQQCHYKSPGAYRTYWEYKNIWSLNVTYLVLPYGETTLYSDKETDLAQDYYIFDKEFYQSKFPIEGRTNFENLLKRMLLNEAYSIKEIKKCVDDEFSFSTETNDMYYRIPIAIWMYMLFI